MAVYMAITAGLEGSFRNNYPAIYIAKVVIVAALLLYFSSALKLIKFEARYLWLGIGAGILGIALWLGIEKIAYPHLGDRTAYVPLTEIPDVTHRAIFMAFRFAGLALVVPVMEEIFWRGFVTRYATNPDFESLEVGQFNATGFAVMCGLFAFAHPEWLAGLVFAMLTGFILWKTKSLFACVVTHAVTNLLLGIYVVTFQQWQLW